MAQIWVRSEQRPFEQRVGVTPQGVRRLLDAGHQVTVERSDSRSIPIDAYAATGCAIAMANDWISAPDDAIIFGLKELDMDGPDLRHRHIMFGHAYKGQADGPHLLSRFKRGGGALYDLEYLVDESGRRVAAFGYWAGFAGAAVGLKAWIAQQKGGQLGTIGVYAGKDTLLHELASDLADVAAHEATRPTVLIIGAKGRVGSGAGDLCKAVGLKTTLWDMEETAHGGPFPEILEHPIFVNSILANPDVPVFVPKDSIDKERKLRVIADVSCDPNSEYNPIPIYDHSTSFVDPVIRVKDEPNPLDVMAIDNLPSLLPVESSEDYAAQLLPHLLQLDSIDTGIWANAKDVFDRFVRQV